MISVDLAANTIASVSEVAISGDGRTAGFVSPDPGLVNGDGNGVDDVFVKRIPLAAIDSVSPATLTRGDTTFVTVAGRGFGENLDLGFGSGITVADIRVVDSTTVTASVTVDAAATVGPRTPAIIVQFPGPGYTSALCSGCVAVA